MPKLTQEQKRQILDEAFSESENCTKTIKNLTKELDLCRRDVPKVESFKNCTKDLSRTKKDLTKVTSWLCKYAEEAAASEESINAAAKKAGISVTPYKFLPGVVKLCPDLIKKDRQIDNDYKEVHDQEEAPTNNTHYAPPPVSEIKDETTTAAHTPPPEKVVEAAGDVDLHSDDEL